jgi:hypothetical protein
MRASGRVILGALGTAIVGGAAFIGGVSAAFGRAGNWSNQLSGFGVLLLVLAGILAMSATCLGIAEAIQERRLNWSLPFAAACLALALWGGWIALHL